MKTAILLVALASGVAVAQQSTTTPKPSATPPAPPAAAQPTAPPPSTLNKQAVQMTPEEQRQMDDAWKDIKIANLGLQVAMESIRLAHPGWKYDLQQQVFYVEVAPATPATGKPATPVAPPNELEKLGNNPDTSTKP